MISEKIGKITMLRHGLEASAQVIVESARRSQRLLIVVRRRGSKYARKSVQKLRILVRAAGWRMLEPPQDAFKGVFKAGGHGEAFR